MQESVLVVMFGIVTSELVGPRLSEPALAVDIAVQSAVDELRVTRLAEPQPHRVTAVSPHRPGHGSFYTTVVRPVLRYACIAWHSSLTKHLKDMLESQQVRAMHIIFNNIRYHEALELSNSLCMTDVNRYFHNSLKH